MDYSRYYDVMGEGGIFTTVTTSRAALPLHLLQHATPSPSGHEPCAGVDELEACLALGIREIYFVDDTFNITNSACTSSAMRSCAAASTSAGPSAWVKGVDRPLLEKMKAAGCQRIQFGVEQGTEEGLLRLKKDVTSLEIESACSAVKWASTRWPTS